MKTINKFLLWSILLLVSLIGGEIYFAFRPLNFAVLPVPFTIKTGSSLKAAAKQLVESDVIPNDLMFVLLARVLGKAEKIKPGDYLLEQSLTPLELLDIVSKGLVVPVELTVVEGSTFKQFRSVLNEHTKLRHDTINLSDAEVLQRLDIPTDRPEGLFFPDTYRVASGSSDLEILKQSFNLMQQHLQQLWEKRAPNLPLQSAYEALILASIVEKETGQAKDRDMIAAVFHNRLKKGMLLQTDPTVIYGIGEKFDGNIRKRDLLKDTPYNTYTRLGLPPTPIALPSLASIQATLHPAQSDALYFVGRGDGSTQFSSTLNQHINAVNQFQK